MTATVLRKNQRHTLHLIFS